MKPIQETINEIKTLFETIGQDQYFGEVVSQYEHAAQAALLAKQQNSDIDVQLAAFLHDIGHLLPIENDQENRGIYGRKNHETIAGEWLRDRGFSEKIIQLIVNHVNAKRYLCYQNPVYLASLSEASRQTLDFQGGPMNAIEAKAFRLDPLFDEILQLRRWDEAAKIQNLKNLPPLSHFLELCAHYLAEEYRAN